MDLFRRSGASASPRGRDASGDARRGESFSVEGLSAERDSSEAMSLSSYVHAERESSEAMSLSENVNSGYEDKDGYSSLDGYTSVGSQKTFGHDVVEIFAGFLWKFNAKSIPKRRYFVLGMDDAAAVTISWTARPRRTQEARVIRMEDVRELRVGRESSTFRSLEAKLRDAQGALTIGARESKLPKPEVCFSLVLVSRKSLDVAAESATAADAWMQALRQHIADRQPTPALPLAPPQHAADEGMPPPLPAATGFRSEEDAVNAIFDAVEEHDNAALRRIFAEGIHVDVMHPVSGDTALMYSCRQGLADVVELCLRLGAKNDPHPAFGQTALQAAVCAGHTQCVEKILSIAAKSRADSLIVNHEDPNQEAPLHIAARCGNEACLELLLQHGAHVHLVDRGGNTCLHGAARGGHYACLAMLLDFGSDAVLNEQNAEGDTPLHVACRSGRTNCAKLLVESAAEVTLSNHKRETAYAVAAALGHRDICRIIAAVNPVVAAAASIGASATTTTSPGRRLNSPRELPLPRPHPALALSPQRKRLQRNLPFGAGGPFQQLGIAGIAHTARAVHSPASYGVQEFAAPLTERLQRPQSAWLENGPASARDQARIKHFAAEGSNAAQGKFFPETGPRKASSGSAVVTSDSGDEAFILNDEQWYRYVAESGYEYFYNETTGVSQWDDPRPPVARIHGSAQSYPSSGVAEGRDAGSNTEREPGFRVTTLGERSALSTTEAKGSEDAKGAAVESSRETKDYVDAKRSSGESTAGAKVSGDVKAVAVAKAPGDARGATEKSAKEAPQVEAKPSPKAEAKARPMDPKYEKFRKMLQAGVPTAAVANKMRLEGLDPDPLVSDFTPVKREEAPTPAPKKGTLPDKPEYEKFRKMLKAGVPKAAVIAKMRSEGVDPTPLENGESGSAMNKNATPARAAAKKGLPDDPKYEKYRRMLKAGVPKAAVAAKMKGDGLDASCLVEDDASPSSRREGRQNKLVNIHWKSVDDLPPERLRKSVWANSDVDPELLNDDIKELESLFSAKAAKPKEPAAEAKPSSRSKKSGKSMLDGRRTNNIEIGLARFKTFPNFNELCECVVRQDSTRLDIDSLSTLISMLPTDQEIQMMLRVPKEEFDELGKAEQWFFTIATSFTKFGPKLRVFKNISSFDESREQCTRDISILQDASDTILESSSFAVVLQRLLAVGNILNEGTYRGNATSISLDSLLSVTTTKGADRKTTVLDYVVRRCLEKKELRILSFADDFQGPVQDAARLSVSETKAEVSRLKEGVAAAERLVKTVGDGDDTTDLDKEFVRKTMAFCDAKGPEVDTLDSQMQTTEGRGLELVEYFAEEPRIERIPDVFKTLRQFLTAFRSSVDKCQRQLKSEERKRRQKDAKSDEKDGRPRREERKKR